MLVLGFLSDRVGMKLSFKVCFVSFFCDFVEIFLHFFHFQLYVAAEN